MGGMEQMVPVDGGEVWADDTGGSGPALVLLHPGIGDSRVWDLVVPQLRDEYRLIRYDTRGFGRSPQPTAPFTLLGDLVAVMDHFDVPKAGLVGCSMGGDAAVSLALAHPRRVSVLVLACPGLHDYPWPEEPELDAEYEAFGAAGDLEGLVSLGLREWAASGADETARAQMRSAVQAWLYEEKYRQEDPPAFDRLGEIAIPSVVLIGDLDRAPLIACNDEMAARIPGCRLVRLPGVDHYLPLRAPDVVAATVRELCR